MKRIFGSSKQQPQPTISLTEATQKVNKNGRSFFYLIFICLFKKMDERVKVLDEKIKALDTELIGYREKLKKTRPGPARNALQQKALRILKQKKMYEGQREQYMTQSFNMEQANFASQTMHDTVATVFIFYSCF